MQMSSSELVERYGAPVPRYTSYPTAPHFTRAVDAGTYRRWLGALDADASLSLYAHIPFCDTMCWFCGCHTKVTQRYAPLSIYLNALRAEIATVGALVPTSAIVRQMHWGGGSPTMLHADDIRGLAEALRGSFTVAPDAQFAIEVDPRGLDAPRVDALLAAGLTRVSVCVQDFDPIVQKAINRIQSFEETRAVVEAFRAGGIRSLNIDALYGLPHQTAERLQRTLAAVVSLQPDRIALFGYAHVPWMKKHQTMIDTNALPGTVERYDHAEAAAAFLVASGYQRIGIDHFARPGDSLARAVADGTLRRNFQGYTEDPTGVLIGLGASAIGQLPQGYVQNIATTALYQQGVGGGALAVDRGVALSSDDRMRAYVIERLMCDLVFRLGDLKRRFGAAALPLVCTAKALVRSDTDGLIRETKDGFCVTERGRPFLRTIAARFDAYLERNAARHSAAV